MSASAVTTTTTRRTRTRTSSAQAAAATTSTTSAVWTPGSPDTTSYGTTPPGTKVLTTTGAGQVLSNAPAQATATNGADSVAPSGLWGATAGLEQGSSSQSNASSSTSSGWSALSTGAKAGIIAGGVLLIAAIIGGIVFAVIRRRKRAEQVSFAQRTGPLRDSFVSPPAPMMFDHDKEKYQDHGNDAYYPPQRRDYGAYARDSGAPSNYSNYPTSQHVVPSPQLHNNSQFGQPYGQSQHVYGAQQQQQSSGYQDEYGRAARYY